MAEEQVAKKVTKQRSYRTSSFTAIRKELQSDLEDLRKLPKGIAKNYEARLKYDTELGEYKVALQEFDLMKEDANVYKSVGPVLVKQDPENPIALFFKTIGHLGAEFERVNEVIRDLRGKTTIKRKKNSLERRLRSLTLKEPNA